MGNFFSKTMDELFFAKEEKNRDDDDDDRYGNDDDDATTSSSSGNGDGPRKERFSNEGATKGTPTRWITEDPRSPATAQVERTPLPSSIAVNNQVAWDPRSPTSEIVRTPLQPPLFDTPPETPEAIQQTNSVTEEQAECEVHRSWQFESLQGLEEGDSMYPNISSVPGELTENSDYGSLENLLMYNTASVGSDDSAIVSGVGESVTSQGTASIPGADTAETDADTAEVDNVRVQYDEVTSSSGSDQPEVADISPIGSPVKAVISTSTSLSPIKKTSEGQRVSNLCEQQALCSSTPNKKRLTCSSKDRPISRGLSARDTNSPLALVQRKQVAKVNSQIMTRDSASSTIDKENLIQ